MRKLPRACAAWHIVANAMTRPEFARACVRARVRVCCTLLPDVQRAHVVCAGVAALAKGPGSKNDARRSF